MAHSDLVLHWYHSTHPSAGNSEATSLPSSLLSFRRREALGNKAMSIWNFSPSLLALPPVGGWLCCTASFPTSHALTVTP